MTRKTFFELAPERRERILMAAAEEFGARGYEAASVNRIVANAEMSKGSLYYYFEDKEDLFATVMEQAMNRLMSEARFVDPEELTADDFWNFFRDVMRRSIDFIRQNEWYVRLGRSFHRALLNAPKSPATRRVMAMWSSYTESLLLRGQQLGVVRNDLPLDLLVELALAVDQAGDRWRLEHWSDLSLEEHKTMGDAHIDVIRDMLHARNQGWEE